MNSGQMMMVIGAFTILSVTTLSVNGMISTYLGLSLEAEATLNAISIAQSMLDEIQTKEFDEKSIGVKIYSSSGMTAFTSFGSETGETVAQPDTIFASKDKFDDIDDYHRYSRRVWNDRMGWFDVVDSIRYATETNPDVLTSFRTFYKRISVYVTNPNLPKDAAGNIIPVVMRDLAVYRRYF